MRKSIRVLSVLAFCSLLAHAQNAQYTPRVELFGGFSVARSSDETATGWNGSAAVNVNDWFGVVADFSRHSKSLSEETPFGRFTADGTITNILFGPRFSARQTKRVTPFGHFLVGTTRASVSASALGFPISVTQNGFTLATGGGLDINAGKHVGFRIVQVDYVRTKFDLGSDDGVRFSTGVVFRF